ncbi:Bud site selection protein BUD4 [Escovopsis weberi]|uniref:Bud site selection protein BUD4 n=1 Tax=Escovopsis weberi TaxID=150374 RepID=A0A0M9VSN8_ESCWE|nr:Bud site selection protein BUD4 [Escovopsis weberi]
MSSDSVQPLRIAKTAPNATPTNMSSNSSPRPLSELSPTERRRNSPSYNQSSPTKRSVLSNDSSPFQSSPLDSATSPRLFWQNRNSENLLNGRSGSGSPNRRSSIERLQKASRVKNSNILALEQKHDYDPTRFPQIERPLARVQMNAFGLRSPTTDKRLPDPFRTTPQKLAPSAMSPAKPSPSEIITGVPTKSPTPSKDQISPVKSSLSPSKFKSSFDHEIGVWSPDASALELRDVPASRPIHRHTKSVTFDVAPPQVNEYEMATPDLSSIGTNSREGSFDSIEEEEDEDDVLYDPNNADGGDDDSFDASLEDTDKTPVVGPDEWAAESPVSPGGREFGQFDGSPVPESGLAALGRPSPNHQRSDSSSSVADHRPLPPLPPFSNPRRQSIGSTSSSPGPSNPSDRIAHRSLPVPPGPASKSDMVEEFIISGKMSLEERLKLVMLSDDNNSTAREQQRERRLRRLSGRDRSSMGSRSTISRDITPNTSAVFTSNDAEDNDDADHKGQTEQGDGKHNDDDDDDDDDLDDDENIGDISGLVEYKTPPRITREAIMRHMNGNKTPDDNMDYAFSSPLTSPKQFLGLDPDVPIPSTEGSHMDDDEDEHNDAYDDDDDDVHDDEDNEGSVIITRPTLDDETDEDDTPLDLSHDSDLEDEIDEDDSRFEQDEPAQRSRPRYEGQDFSFTEEESVLSPPEPLVIANEAKGSRTGTPDVPPVVVQRLEPDQDAESQHDLSLLGQPDDVSSDVSQRTATAGGDRDDARSEETLSVAKTKPKGFLRLKTERLLPKPAYDGSGWGEPEDEYEDEEPGSPESVIHHPISDDEDFDEDESYYEEMDDEEDQSSDDTARYSPAIPEEIATIKASGSKLKTRVSNTPSDIAAMREARRQVSGEIPHVPSIPEQHHRLGSGETDIRLDMSHEEFLARHPSFKNRSLTLDLETGLSLDKDFERVIESQKRGYLMRQNTKLVSASDKDGEDGWRSRNNAAAAAAAAPTTPIKPIRPQSWTVEPWNGSTRRSVRKGPGSSGPVPPVPGRESNTTSLNRVVEEDAMGEMAALETGERGRLFIKVMGVKDLDLPIPKNERSWFSLTLDNGVHCVTTAWLELARNAPIGQEFELVVPNDLEFQLTLNVKLEKPTYAKLQPSQIKMTKPKTSTFSRVFASPKKRRELEQRQRAEEERFAQQQMEALARERKNAGSAYELLSPFAAEDGSFARAYVCLKEHETCCYGRPYTVDVACFNEWATEEESFASTVKSKRGNGAIVRRAPYKIGKLELQLLFVPRPKNVTDEDMPKSMNSCIRELKAAEERLARNWEGLLSQNGGDCPYWRRRYFKLVGTKLTAYHEATRQPRATINLSNAKRLIDDRRTLTEKDTLGKGGKRRRSAFAEEEEGFMFVEEGFRIRFNNGELIDFYADTAEDKEGWIKALSDVIGRGESSVEDEASGPRSRAKWCELVLKREEQLRRRSESKRIHSRTKSMYL